MTASIRRTVLVLTLALMGTPLATLASGPHASSAPTAPATTAKAVPTEKGKATTTIQTEPDTRPWATLLAGNRRFMRGEHLVRPVRELRQETAKGQHPDVIVLTCSDSRLSPEILFDQSIGELFVVRTAGNLVDPIALGSIEYAVEHLHAKLLVVMGHERCGAVDAALAGGTMPTENLEAIVRKIRPGIPPARPGASKDALLQDAIEANVRRSATDCVVASPIVREHVVHGSLAVVQAIYRLSSGEVEELRASEPAADNH
ncbi:MAG: carbonic anhydrase [Candidatus Eisenbacteria bacterium]